MNATHARCNRDVKWLTFRRRARHDRVVRRHACARRKHRILLQRVLVGRSGIVAGVRRNLTQVLLLRDNPSRVGCRALQCAYRLSTANAGPPAWVCLLRINGGASIRPAHFPMIYRASRRDHPHDPRGKCRHIMLPLILFCRTRGATTTRKVTVTISRASHDSNVFGLPLIAPATCLQLTDNHLQVNVRVLYRQSGPILNSLCVKIRRRCVFYLRLLRYRVMSINGAIILFRRGRIREEGLTARRYRKDVHETVIHRVRRDAVRLQGARGEKGRKARRVASIPVRCSGDGLVRITRVLFICFSDICRAEAGGPIHTK